MRDLARSVKVLRIKSISQTVTKDNKIILEGEVELLIDRRLHVWADRVYLDKEKQIVIAEMVGSGGAVTIEDENFLILADRFVFNMLEKTGHADNLRLHVDEGYVSAKKAEKLNETDWKMEDMMYTACDDPEPHWSIKAHRAVVQRSYLVKTKGLVFEIGSIPVFGFPRFAFPVQSRSKSGFLMPRFAYDYEYGFGIKQEYYKYFTPHFDTTLGVDWRDRKGIVFSDELRLGRAPEKYTLFNFNYGILRDQYVQRQNKVVKGTMRRYWINGKDYRGFEKVFNDTDVNTLLRLDFGIDKRLGYHFFNDTQEVDDMFNNSFIMRTVPQKNQISLSLDNARTSRIHFVNPSFDDKEKARIYEAQEKDPKAYPLVVKEYEDRVDLAQLPHGEWNTAFYGFGNILWYRHDLFLDQIRCHKKEIERLFVDSTLIDERFLIPYSKADLIRFNYNGHLTESCSLFHNALSWYIDPHFQVVNLLEKNTYSSTNVLEGKMFAYGAYRLFFEYGAEWALPEGVVYSPNKRYQYSIQPLLTWQLTPKFAQDNWFYLDKWDRAYPKNEIAGVIRNGWDIDDVRVDFDIKQGYDFYNRYDIFPLRRGIEQKHWLPFRYDLSCMHEHVYIGFGQEYEWRKVQLLQSEINLILNVNKVQFGLGYLFQKRELLDQRMLLSNVPHFITANLTVPIGKSATITYDGQFYASQRSALFYLDGIAPLIHRVRFNYDGHCWGMYVGFEEKKYKEYGIGRDEQSIVFSFRLDSLGSFAKKFRRIPQIIAS
jgi:hypothetical protein